MSQQPLAQTQKSFQKQDGIFLGSKRVVAKGRAPRYYRSIGLGFKTPEEAIKGNYVDKKCPFTGNVSDTPPTAATTVARVAFLSLVFGRRTRSAVSGPAAGDGQRRSRVYVAGMMNDRSGAMSCSSENMVCHGRLFVLEGGGWTPR